MSNENIKNKDEIQKKIDYLIEQQKYIKKELQQTKKQYRELCKVEAEQYIGKCYKQELENEYDSKTVYYKILDFYDELDNYNEFWVLVVEDHIENDINISSSYIHRGHIDLLGHNFLRQLTPISDKKFNEAIDSVYNHVIDMSGKVPNKEAEYFELKCPKCDSSGPLVVLYPNITDVEYTCEKCGCKYIAKFQHGECVSTEEE